MVDKEEKYLNSFAVEIYSIRKGKLLLNEF